MHGKNDFAEVKILAKHIDLKITLLNYKNNNIGQHIKLYYSCSNWQLAKISKFFAVFFAHYT